MSKAAGRNDSETKQAISLNILYFFVASVSLAREANWDGSNRRCCRQRETKNGTDRGLSFRLFLCNHYATTMTESNELFSARFNKQQRLIFTFLPNFRNHQWSKDFGKIQTALHEEMYEGRRFEKVSFDFQNCLWIDPAPFLSFLITLQQYAAKRKANSIYVRLPQYAGNDEKIVRKIIKFLATENFLSFLFDNCQLYGPDGNIIQNSEEIEVYKSFDVELNYANSTIVKCQVIDVGTMLHENTLSQWVTERLEEARVNLLDKEIDQTIEDILYKLNLFLDETLQNVAAHAYQPGDTAWAGVFIRYRFGIRNSSIPAEERQRLKSNFSGERKHCPQLDTGFGEISSGFIEIFVVDNGIGLVQTFSTERQRYPFRDAIIRICKHGERRSAVIGKDKTAKGGLSLIYRTLHADNNFLCGFTEGEWIGDYVPFNLSVSYLYTGGDAKGVCWIGRLSMNSSLSLDESEWKHWDGSQSMSPIVQAYADPPLLHKEFLSLPFSDFRFGDQFNLLPLLNKNRAKLGAPYREDCFLLLVPRNITKTKVWEMLQEALQNIHPLTARANRTILIVDIPENEAFTYMAALHEARIYVGHDEWTTKVSKIILVTRKFHVSVLNRSNNTDNERPGIKATLVTFTCQNNEAQAYIDSEKWNKEHFQPADTLRDLISFLKLLDTSLLWEYLGQSKDKAKSFVNAEIIWNEEKKIVDGYLNFSSILADGFVKDVFKINLERLYGFFPEKNALLVSTDSLTKPLTEEFNALFQNKKGRGNRIYVGSVYASGVQQEEAVAEQGIDRKTFIVNFMIHPASASPSNRLAVFFWPGSVDIDRLFTRIPKKEKTYERIGKTHAIAEWGSKFFPIPRYTKNETSFYKRSPKDSYKDWQALNPSIVSIGNQRYGDYYDLVKVDINKAIAIGFKYKTEIADFLVTEFAFALGALSAADLTPYGRATFLQDIEYTKSTDKKIDRFYQDISLIVYANHLNTATAIEAIKKVFSHELTGTKLVPLEFIRAKNDTNAQLITPIILDHIAAIIQHEKKRRGDRPVTVLFFDCSLVSGRTRKQVKHTLLGLGVDVVKTLVLLDRSRLPYTLPNEDFLRAFWRLDVPRLAYNDQNLLNNTLKEIKFITSSLVQPAVERTRHWEEIWGGSALPTERDQGIKPTRLKEKRQTRKFGISRLPPHDQIGGPGNLVDLVNSFGLTLYAAEAHSMTGKDDMAVNLLKWAAFEPSVIIELISSQLLLFPEDFSRDLQLRLAEMLFWAAAEIDEADNYTALAAMVLIAQREELIKRLFKQLAQGLSARIKALNLDLLLCLAYWFTNYDLTGEREFHFTRYDSLLVRHADDDLQAIYKRFHYDIYESRGKMHERPIQDLISSNPIPAATKLAEALRSFSKIQNIFSHDIIDWFLNREHDNKISCDYIVTLMRQSYQHGKVLLDNPQQDYQKFVHLIKNIVMPELYKIHRALFFKIYAKEEATTFKPLYKWTQRLVESIIAEREKWKSEAASKKATRFSDAPPVIQVSKALVDFPEEYAYYDGRWLFLDHMVKTEISNWIYNALYAQAPLKDPQNTTTAEADLWIHFSYETDGVVFHFSNLTRLTEEDIAKRILHQGRQERRHCLASRGLNCQLSHTLLEAGDFNLLQIHFKIPIV